MNTDTMFAFANALFCGALAFSVLRNEKRSVVHLAFVIGVVVLAVESVLNGLAKEAGSVEEMAEWQRWQMLVLSLLPGIWIFFSLSYGRGNYREFLKRWQGLLMLAFLIPPGLGIFFKEQLFRQATQVAGHWVLDLGLPGVILNLIFLLAMVFVLMNLEWTYRASVGTMRWRIKFMVLGLMVLFATRCYTSIQALLFQRIDLQLQRVDAVALLVACVLILRALFRAGHFDLDVYPSASVLKSSLAALLVGLYLLVIGVFAQAVKFFGIGGDSFPIKALVVLAALVSLTILLLSERVRLHGSRFISRHFQRPLYDYRNVWRSFTEATASCVNQAELCRAAVKSATDIFQSLSVTIWLVDDRRENLVFAASTFLSEAKAEGLRPEKTAVAGLIQFFQAHHEPADIDSSNEPWAETLRQCHPDEFRKGGSRVCVPMIASDEILGFMVLGDRVGGVSFTWQDFDLLKCIGDQIAAGLLNTRLSQKLMHAKEFEAFQTMSAFFVHDLKNTANTLNLMLQNLPVHFDDPAFRADALRGVAKTVAHINHLIGRLGSIRQALQIKPVPADLNELVIKALAGWEENAGINLVKELGPVPKVFCDPEQIVKVAINLIFNAREAVTREGQVQLQTAQVNGWGVLTVTDTGCGMTPEFMNRSLFRPFQTTKKNGLGIGMFQSKMIVEAHQGRIEVESEAGKGTTFRLFLPLHTQS